MRILIERLTKRFGGLAAVNRVDLEVGDGELFTLLGPSGCGKTTLLRCLAGFYRPDEGTIRFGDRVVTTLPPYERNIGMVFQNYALWPHMTVVQNIAYGLKLRKLSREEIQRRVADGLTKVNLTGMEARYPGQLSGGQQQRVALARALVLNPDILLLDEPLSNLDAKIRVQVRAEIRKLQQMLQITTIYVTHDQEEALTLSDRVAVMRDGAVLQVAAPKALYERPSSRFVADFVGTNNLLDGRVTGGEAPAPLVVRTALGEFRALANANLKAGDACVISIRPENVAIAAGSTPPVDGNHVRGRVSFSSYLGSALRYDVEAPGGLILKADIKDPWHHEILDVGREVVLSFAPSATLAIAPEPARG